MLHCNSRRTVLAVSVFPCFHFQLQPLILHTGPLQDLCFSLLGLQVSVATQYNQGIGTFVARLPVVVACVIRTAWQCGVHNYYDY